MIIELSVESLSIAGSGDYFVYVSISRTSESACLALLLIIDTRTRAVVRSVLLTSMSAH